MGRFGVFFSHVSSKLLKLKDFHTPLLVSFLPLTLCFTFWGSSLVNTKADA